MSGYEVDPAAVFAAAHQLDVVRDDLRQQLSRLASRADALLGSKWIGAAATSLSADFERWRSAIVDQLTLLETDIERLQAAGRAYGANDAESAQLLKQAGAGA